MIYAILIGISAGVLSSVVLGSIEQFYYAHLFNELTHFWFLIPAALSALLLIINKLFKLDFQKERGFAQPFTELNRSYLLGYLFYKPQVWLFRSMFSLLSMVLLGSLWGLEGFIIEANYALARQVITFKKVLIEEKQSFILAIISSALAVVLNAPFSAALVAFELLTNVDTRLRMKAVVASLTAYGVAHFFFKAYFPDHLVLLRQLVEVLPATQFEFTKSLPLLAYGCLLALGLTLFFSLLFRTYGYLFRVLALYPKFTWKIRLIVLSALMMLTLYFSPQEYIDSQNFWQNLVSQKLSSGEALELLLFKVSLLSTAMIGWFSAGIITPIMGMAALLAYSVANYFWSDYIIPLVLIASLSSLTMIIRIPLAVAVLSLELTKNPEFWLQTSVVIAVVYGFQKYFKISTLNEIYLETQSLKVQSNRIVSVLEKILLKDACEKELVFIHANVGFANFRQLVNSAKTNYMVVVNERLQYHGLLQTEYLPKTVRKLLRASAKDEELQTIEKIFEINDLIDSKQPFLNEGDSLLKALDLLVRFRCLAVVNANKEVVGVVTDSSIQSVYNKELMLQVKLFDYP